MKTEIGPWASYINVKEWDDKCKPLKTKELTNSIYLDYAANGELIGIEILSKLEPELPTINLRQYYVQIQCFLTDSLGKVKDPFIEEGFLEQYDDYVVYRDLQGNSPEIYTSMAEFRKSFMHDIKDFNKYVKLLELK